MAITADTDILASDFVGSSSGASDSGKVAKLDALGKLLNDFLTVYTPVEVVMPPLPASTQSATASGNGHARIASDTNGSVIFLAEDLNNDSTTTIFRLEKDTKSGNYKITHSTTLATTTAGGIRQVVVVGSYVYVFAVISGANACRRYDKADLANVTTMTFSGTSRADVGFTDGTNIFISDSSGSTYDKFTISGTTLTNTGGVTFTSSSGLGATCDGTNVFIADSNGGTSTYNIRKYALTGGAVISTTTFPLRNDVDLNAGYANLIMGNTEVLGMCWLYNTCSPTAIIGIRLHFYGITKP